MCKKEKFRKNNDSVGQNKRVGRIIWSMKIGKTNFALSNHKFRAELITLLNSFIQINVKGQDLFPKKCKKQVRRDNITLLKIKFSKN